METKEKDKRNSNPKSEDPSALDRIYTPPPAQEIYPLEQSSNDGRQKPDEGEKKDDLNEEKKERNEKH